MACSVNILSHNKTVIQLDFPTFIKLQNPKFTPKCTSLRQRLLSRKRTSISASATKVANDEKSSKSTTNMWGEFGSNVSGEWDGYGAEFTSEGKPIELPENVVPEAYKEWEVQVFDWQIQCSTLAKSEENVIVYKLIKLLPTVGCEADAATRYSIDERIIGGVDNKASAFGYHSSGCYVVLWPIKDNGSFKLLELEHCLVDPQNWQSRVRIVQVVQVDKNVFSLQNIKVFREQWYGPFKNGEQLGGCAIQDSGFASMDPTERSEISGVWKGSSVVASFQSPLTNIFQELEDEKLLKSVKDGQNLVMLPKHLWCWLEKNDNGETCAEVGWLLEKGRAITSRCKFLADGKLKEIAIGHESKILDGI